MRANSFLTVVLCLLGAELSAFSFIPPKSLAELAQSSDAVVFAEAVSTRSFARGSLVFSATEFVVHRQLAGELTPGETFWVHTPGGTAAAPDDSDSPLTWLVHGSPEFAVGDRYVLCLDRRTNGQWLPKLLAYGVLIEEDSFDGPILSPLNPDLKGAVPRADGIEPERIANYHRDPLLNHLESVLRRDALWTPSDVLAPLSMRFDVRPEGCVFNFFNELEVRWELFDAAGTLTMRTDLDGDSSRPNAHELFEEAVARWQAIDKTSLKLQLGEPIVVDTCNPAVELNYVDGVFRFDDPCEDIADLNETCTVGVYALGGPLIRGSHTFDNSIWSTIVGWGGVMNNGTGCMAEDLYLNVLTNTVSFALGFGFSPQRESIFYERCCNGVFTENDLACVRYVYPSEPLDVDGQLPGDCNEDGDINISDAICLFGHLFLGSNELPCWSRADNLLIVDHNGDGDLNLTDGIAQLRWLVAGGLPHVQGLDCIAVETCGSVCEVFDIP